MAKLGFRAAWDFGRAVAGLARGDESARSATVTRVEPDGAVWVRMAGAESEVPLDGTLASAQVGDTVTVGWIGGAPTASGNASDPAAGSRGLHMASELARVAGSIAQEAKAVADATNQHFFSDSGGIHVTEAENDPMTEHNILINSLGILLRHATNALVSITQSAIAFYDSAANIVARFGADGSQIGRDGESHMALDYHSMQLVDKEGDAYFHVSDMRDRSGVYSYTEDVDYSDDDEGISPAVIPNFTFPFYAQGYTVTIDGVTPDTANWTSSVENDCTMLTWSGTTFTHGVYTFYGWSTEDAFKAYTLGRRATEYSMGGYSVAEGQFTAATASASHAEGRYSVASGNASHAEGVGTISSGYASHTEGGEGSHAYGQYSHAQNMGSIAASQAQTAMGKFNVQDSSGTYALIVGNGTSTSSRSNALTLAWDGTLGLAKALPTASGGTGSTGYGTVITNDISTAVSVPSGSYKSLGSVTLAAGDWIVSYNSYFTSNATGRRYMLLHNAADASGTANLRQGGVSVNAVDGGVTMANACRVLHLTSQTTYYLNVWQNSGSALNATGYIRAFRLK